MIKKILWFQIFSLFFLAHAFASDAKIPIYALNAVTDFEGDRHGQFRGDLIAILGDGSGWKIHPLDGVKFSRWNAGDAIQVCKRTTKYWFKREHKFELYNHSNQETVRVMLVQYPDNPTYIYSTDTYLAGTKLISYTWVDAQGWMHYDYYTVNIYHKILHLSNGTSWLITDKSEFSNYCENDPVYMGYNVKETNISPFLISGTQREAHWVWTYPK